MASTADDPLELTPQNRPARAETPRDAATYKIFWHEVEVPPRLKPWIETASNMMLSWIGEVAGGLAERMTIGLLKRNGSTDEQAKNAGALVEKAIQYGLQVGDVAIATLHTAVQGWKQVDALNRDAAEVLAARGNPHFGVLMTDSSVLTQERQQRLEEVRRELLMTAANIVGKLPLIIQDYWKKSRLPEDPQDQSALRISQAAWPDWRKSVTEALAHPLTAGFTGALGAQFLQSMIDEKEPKTTAFRLIQELQQDLQNDAASLNRDEMRARVQTILERHATDCGYEKLPSGPGFQRIVAQIAEALADPTGALHPMALVDALDSKRAIAVQKDGYAYASEAAMQDYLRALNKRYSLRVTHRNFYDQASFDKEDVAGLFHHLEDKEKAFVAMLFPPGILPEEEAAARQKIGQDEFRHDLRVFFESLLKRSDLELERIGLDKALVHSLREEGNEFLRHLEHDRNVTAQEVETAKELARDLLVTSYKNSWRERVEGEPARGVFAVERGQDALSGAAR
jgi:hypothetical protein